VNATGFQGAVWRIIHAAATAESEILTVIRHTAIGALIAGKSSIQNPQARA
jgi:hypothetical protein